LREADRRRAQRDGDHGPVPAPCRGDSDQGQELPPAVAGTLQPRGGRGSGSRGRRGSQRGVKTGQGAHRLPGGNRVAGRRWRRGVKTGQGAHRLGERVGGIRSGLGWVTAPAQVSALRCLIAEVGGIGAEGPELG
jgi:hypothetical protein